MAKPIQIYSRLRNPPDSKNKLLKCWVKTTEREDELNIFDNGMDRNYLFR